MVTQLKISHPFYNLHFQIMCCFSPFSDMESFMKPNTAQCFSVLSDKQILHHLPVLTGDSSRLDQEGLHQPTQMMGPAHVCMRISLYLLVSRHWSKI